MKVQLKPSVISKEASDEERLIEDGLSEAIYMIRKLRAVINYRRDWFDVKPEHTNKHKQIFLPEFEIWMNKEDYKVVG